MNPLDLSGPEAFLASLADFVAFGDRAGTSPAWLIQQAWDQAPDMVRAGLALALESGDDRVRSAVLTAARALPAELLLAPLLRDLPDWLDHPDPERMASPLGRRLVEAAVEQRALVVDDAVAERFGAGPDLLWRDMSADPCGAGLARLRAWLAAGRPLGHQAHTFGLICAGAGRPCLPEVAALVWGTSTAERRAFLRAVGPDGAPGPQAHATLAAAVAAVLGAPGSGRFQDLDLQPLEPVEAGWAVRFRLVDDADAFSQYDRTTTWEGQAVLDPLAGAVLEGSLRVTAAGEASHDHVGRELRLAGPGAPEPPAPEPAAP